jgi:hypothetical protein
MSNEHHVDVLLIRSVLVLLRKILLRTRFSLLRFFVLVLLLVF